MKNRKFIFMVFTLACFIAIGVCLIVDIAINQHITWAAYTSLSIPFGWAVSSPLLIRKRGILLLLCAVTLLVGPYLYLLSGITPVKDWFMPVGAPSAITGVVSLWILVPLFRYTKMNIWYKSAITVFVLGVCVSTVVNYFVDIYLKANPFMWNRFLSLFVCIVASAALGILGYMRSKSAKN